MKRVGVLFVCLGNICRSPVAEGVFRQLVHQAGMQDRFLIDSAGTSGYHDGDGPDPRSCATAAARGIILDHTSRRIRPRDFEQFDYILAMDGDNLEAIRALAERSGHGSHPAIGLLRDYDPEAEPGSEVPDPYYGGPRGFDEVHDLVERACAGLLRTIVTREGLAQRAG